MRPGRNKYGNRQVVITGEHFDSRLEARRYQELLLLERAGKITELYRQVEFELIPAQYEEYETGKIIKRGPLKGQPRVKRRCLEKACKYIADFTYNDENGYTIYSYVDVTNVPNNAPVAGPEVNPATAAGTTASASTPSTVPAPATSTAAAPENTTINPDEFPTLPEISNGIILVRTKYASRGDLVSVSVVMANPNSEYTIEFYETDTRVSDSAGLEPKIASSNGTVEWRFTLDYDCQIGTRKLIIREKGTDNYAQTYIIVNG